MPRTSNRLEKVADLLKKELAVLIQTEIRDPRVGMVSVTGVRVSRDFAHAEIFVTMLGKASKEEIEDGITALNRGAGYLRTLLSKNISLRITPKLKFHYDDSAVRGAYLSGLIDEAIAQDSQHKHNDDEND